MFLRNEARRGDSEEEEGGESKKVVEASFHH
jgi:hypothetical protein